MDNGNEREPGKNPISPQDDQNQVVNEQDQNRVVNPTGPNFDNADHSVLNTGPQKETLEKNKKAKEEDAEIPHRIEGEEENIERNGSKL